MSIQFSTPVVSSPSPSGVQSVNSGNGINVDNTDPQNPIVNSIYAYGQAESQQIINLLGSPFLPLPENLILFDSFSSVRNLIVNTGNSSIDFTISGAYLITINLNVKFLSTQNIFIYPRINGNNDLYYAQVFNFTLSGIGDSAFVGFSMLKSFSAGDSIQFIATTLGTGTSIEPDAFFQMPLSVRITANYVGAL